MGSKNKFLGRGAYGDVREIDGMAVKKFKQYTHLIQEWSSGLYLRNAKCIVHPQSFDFENLTLSMDLYDNNLSRLLRSGVEFDRWTILKDILIGLTEDRKSVV